MATTKPLAAAFEEINRQMIGMHQFNAQQRQAEVKWSMDSLLMEEQMKDAAIKREQVQLSMDAQRMANQIQQYKVEEAKAYYEPQNFSLFDTMGRDWMGDQEATTAVKQLFSPFSATGTNGVMIGQADGQVYIDERPLQMSMRDFETLVPHLDFIRRGADPDPQRWMKEAETLNLEIADLKKQKTGLGKRPIQEQRMGMNRLSTEIARKQSRLSELKKRMEPENLSAWFADEAGEFERMALLMSSRNMSKAASYYQRQADKMWQGYMTGLKAAGKGAKWAPERKAIYDWRKDSETYGQIINHVNVAKDQPLHAAHTYMEGAKPEDVAFNKPPALKKEGDLNHNQMNKTITDSFPGTITIAGKSINSEYQAINNTALALGTMMSNINGKNPNLDAPNQYTATKVIEYMQIADDAVWNNIDTIRRMSPSKKSKNYVGNRMALYGSAKHGGAFAQIPPQQMALLFRGLAETDPGFANFAKNIDRTQFKDDDDGGMAKLINAYVYNSWKNEMWNKNLSEKGNMINYEKYAWKQAYFGTWGIDPSNVYDPDESIKNWTKAKPITEEIEE